MAQFSVKLWEALQKLTEDDFKRFKWFLKQDDVSEGHSGISVAQLEKADRQDTVDLMGQKYGSAGAVKETVKVLERIDRRDIAESLQNPSLDPKNLRPLDFCALREDYERKRAELRSLQTFAVDVRLNPDAAHPNITLSCDRKLFDSPDRFYSCVCWSAQRTAQKEGSKPEKS